MVNDAYKKIGERVKNYRTNKGLSQPELAEDICSRQTISLLENGQHLPSAEIMKKIAVKLGVPIHEILVNEANELELKVQIDLIHVYIETGDYTNALKLIDEFENQAELLEYQRREIIMAKAECLIQTGRALNAVQILTELQQRLELERETNDHFLAVVYEKLGTANYRLSNVSIAHANYMRAYQISLRFTTVDLTAARIAYNLGMTSRLLNLHSDAIQYLNIAESFFEKNSDQKRLAQTFFELGIAFQSDRNFEQADYYYQKALAFYESENVIRQARLVRESYAFTILAQKSPHKAIEEMVKLLEEFERENDFPQLAYTCSRTAKLLLKQKRVEEAGGYLQSVIEKLSITSENDSLHLSHVYQVYAEYLYEIKDFDRCVQYAFMASEQFGKIGLVRDAADSLRPAVQAFREQGMLDKALDVSEQVCDMLQNR